MARELKWPNGTPQARWIDERTLGAARDKIVRNNSVANDIRLNLPISIQRPDGEERPTPFPSGYDSRSEIQRPYIKPPPNKTVSCISEPNGHNNSPSCSCGPTICHSVQKSGSTSSSSGWGLSWNKGNKSPPSSHNRQQHQRPPQSSNPSTFRSSTVSNNGTKLQKSVLGPQTCSAAGVFSNFLAGVITSASEKGGGSHCKATPGGKSITQERLHYDQEQAKTRLLSDKKPAIKNDRTNPPVINVNSSMFSGAEKRTDDTVLNCLQSSKYSSETDLQENSSSPHPGPLSQKTLVVESSSHPFECYTILNADQSQLSFIPIQSEDKNGNTPTLADRTILEGTTTPSPTTDEMRDGNSKNAPSPLTDWPLYQPKPNNCPVLRENLEATGHYELSEPCSTNQLSDQYFNSEVPSSFRTKQQQ